MRASRLTALVIVLAPAIASAHVRITSPTPRTTAQLKDRHCGLAGSTRANVQTYKPGATVHLVWDEYVAHPGWFRISFQQNGDVFEVPPPSNGPSSTGASNYPTENLTGKVDATTGSLIIADRIAHPALSMDVTLPNVECSNCTLQLTQMMIDKPPYSDDAASNDIYYACVDLVLTSSAPAPDAGATAPDGGDVSGDAGTGGGHAGGGCSASHGGGSAMLALAIVGLLRRRRPALAAL
jgi:uncharacterized protein (TIGR03382 family)